MAQAIRGFAYRIEYAITASPPAACAARLLWGQRQEKCEWLLNFQYLGLTFNAIM
jgi:hypothetical protein